MSWVSAPAACCTGKKVPTDSFIKNCWQVPVSVLFYSQPLRMYTYCPGQRHNSVGNYWSHNSYLDILTAVMPDSFIRRGETISSANNGCKAMACSVQTRESIPSKSPAGSFVGFRRSDRLFLCCSLVSVSQGWSSRQISQTWFPPLGITDSV